MGSLKAVCGVAAVALMLAGCGGSSGSAMSGANASADASAAGVATGTGAGVGSGSGAGSGGGTSAPGSASLAWKAPTTNTNGTALTDLAGYHIYYGTNSGSLSNEIDVPNPATVSYVVGSLTAGTWYFAVTAYTNTGLEGPKSNVGSKTVT